MCSAALLTHGNVEGALWIQLKVVELDVRLVQALDEHLWHMRKDLHAHASILQPEVDLVHDALAEAVDHNVLHGDPSLEQTGGVAVGALSHLEGIEWRNVQLADAVLHAWRYLLEALLNALADVDVTLPAGRNIPSCRMPSQATKKTTKIKLVSMGTLTYLVQHKTR